jgi:integrase
VLNYAVNNDWLSRSPARGIKLPKITSTRSYALKDEDVARIAEATVQTYRPMVWLGALTGCRWSEAAGLRVCDLNLLERTMRIEQVVVKDEHGRPIVRSPKSEASRRTVSLPVALAEMPFTT